MKKTQLILLILINTISINIYANNNGKIDPTDSLVADSICGEWSICQTIGIDTTYEKGSIVVDKTIYCFSVCPTIIFRKGGGGNYIDNVHNVKFYWCVYKGYIRFSFENKKDQKSFLTRCNKFRYKMYNDAGSFCMDLIDYGPKCRYHVLIKNTKLENQ